ncbi:MAG: hypothetical protein ACTSR1_01790 [Candidatus Heimdallarchaeota archaeon]
MDVVGGATVGAFVGALGGNGGVDIVGGATLGGTIVDGLVVGGPTVGILGGVGIGEAGFDGGVPKLGGPLDGTDGGIGTPDLGGPDDGGLGIGGAADGIPGVLDGGGRGVPVLGITSPLNRSLLCQAIS